MLAPTTFHKKSSKSTLGVVRGAWCVVRGAQTPPCPLRGRVPTTHQGSVPLLSGYTNIVYLIYNLISPNALTPIYLNLGYYSRIG